MGNNPGPVDEGKHLDVVIRMHGPIRGDEALKFKTDLDALIAKYRNEMHASSGGYLTRPVKGSARRQAKET